MRGLSAPPCRVGRAATTFIVPELTLAPSVPAMADLVPLFEASRAEALTAAESRAKELLMRLAA